MDSNQAWRLKREFVEADPNHQKLREAHLTLCRQVQSYDTELRSGTFALQRLLVARDCVEHFQGKLDCTSYEEDQQLEEWTANHGEAWGGMYRQAAEELTESMLDLCDVLSSKRAKRKAAHLEREMAWDCLRQCADELEKRYDVEQVEQAPQKPEA